MRSRTMLVLVCALTTIGAGLGAVSAAARQPTTAAQERAQNRGIRGAASAIANLRITTGGLGNSVTALNSGLTKAQGQIATLNTLSAALPGLLSKLANGLTAIQTALQDPVTGLVGLNTARPQFGVFGADGSFLGGTGSHPPAQGPSAAAAHTTGTGVYIVSFDDDVSSRVYQVNVLPAFDVSTGHPIPLAASAQAVNCSDAASLCGTSTPADVAVVIETQDSGSYTFAASGQNALNILPGDRSFSLTAISG